MKGGSYEMRSTVACLLESQTRFNVSATADNLSVYDKVEVLPSNIRNKLGFTLEKVNILRDKEHSKYFVEYSNNLERYMKDQQITLNEAMDNICEHYTLFQDDVAIVVDEACVNKIDMPSLVKEYSVFKI